MGGTQSGTMERDTQNDTIILETFTYQMGLGTYMQFLIKNESVPPEQSVAKSVKDAEN